MKLCTVCGAPFVQAPIGRPRLYCSRPCKESTPTARKAKLARGARYRDREDRREAARTRTAEWRVANPERLKAINRANYERNHARRLAEAASYRDANRERLREAARVYGKAHPDIVWRSDANRRARERRAFVEVVDRWVLYQRDKGICGLCGGRVKREDASVDHIIPLSMGGAHSYANTQIAHLSCNLKRGNRGPAQVRMLP